MLALALAAVPAVLWAVVLALPWRPWATRERLDAEPPGGPEHDLSDVTVLIPARDEAPHVGRALASLAAQGQGLRAVLVDDGSADGTARVARAVGLAGIEVITGAPLPVGWTGKLWALEQGRRRVGTRLTLLMDADIELRAGLLRALRAKMTADGLQLVSLLAAPNLGSPWERLLMPAFVYFFKLLYPFRLSNRRGHRVAAAAGGCVLVETRVLEEMGGFEAIKGELIDDCALARHVKGTGHATWIGLSRSLHTTRRQTLRALWNMVARTAFTQLRYSVAALAVCTLALTAAFALPVAGLAFADGVAQALALAAWGLMAASYWPTVRFYGLSPGWALTLPFAATLYLGMTWSSALRYWRGERSRWKERRYCHALTATGEPPSLEEKGA